MKRKIGYIRNRYPEIRNIINRSSDGNTYLQIAKCRYAALMFCRACEIMTGRLIRRSIKMNNDIHAVYKPVVSPKVDVIHTFNTVCDTDVPWVSTFETMIPRTNQLCGRAWELGGLAPGSVTKYGFEQLAKDSCKALIALSEANKNIQLRIMNALDVENRDIIEKKITVLHPPQPVLISPQELEAKFENLHDCVEFIFIGGLFYRKGGAQVLDAMQEMVAKGMRLHLTLVSSISDDGFTHITQAEKDHYTQMIAGCEWITHYPQLPNAQVLELCKKAHVGLLPSMADTYGYAVLEMMAGGCAVITTDIRAMPEMNNDECGFLIRVPKHPSTEAKYDTPEDLEILKNTIYTQLCELFAQIWKDPECVRKKAKEAVSKIERDHNPQNYAKALNEIYESACR